MSNELLITDLVEAILDKGRKCASGEVLVLDRLNLEYTIKGVLGKYTPEGVDLNTARKGMKL